MAFSGLMRARCGLTPAALETRSDAQLVAQAHGDFRATRHQRKTPGSVTFPPEKGVLVLTPNNRLATKCVNLCSSSLLYGGADRIRHHGTAGGGKCIYASNCAQTLIHISPPAFEECQILLTLLIGGPCLTQPSSLQSWSIGEELVTVSRAVT